MEPTRRMPKRRKAPWRNREDDVVDQATFQQVYGSFCRCAASKKFYEDFYKAFFNSSTEVRAKFKNTDMKRQMQALDKSLGLMVMFAAEQNSIARQALLRVAELHNSDHHDIHPRLYDLWLESLMKTVEKHDKTFNNELDRQWRKVLAVGIDFFRHTYYFGPPGKHSNVEKSEPMP